MRIESPFIRRNLDLLLRRFALTYNREDFCLEYFILRQNSREIISHSLVFSYNPAIRDLHVSRFHPCLYVETDSKYLSAACFYLLIHHCANMFFLDDSCRISLETVPQIYETFYHRLKDFSFAIGNRGLGNVVGLVSAITRSGVDTSMIEKHVFPNGETAFLY